MASGPPRAGRSLPRMALPKQGICNDLQRQAPSTPVTVAIQEGRTPPSGCVRIAPNVSVSFCRLLRTAPVKLFSGLDGSGGGLAPGLLQTISGGVCSGISACAAGPSAANFPAPEWSASFPGAERLPATLAARILSRGFFESDAPRDGREMSRAFPPDRRTSLSTPPQLVPLIFHIR